MPEETKVKVSIGVPPIAVGIDVPLELRRWFRWGKRDIVTRLHRQVHRDDKVTLKICCYTLQTTLTILLRLFGKLAESKRFPDVEVVILRPDLTRPLRIWKEDDPNDRRYWEAVREDGTTSKYVREFIQKQYPRVEFKERFFPFDPCVKTIIANDCVAFFGLYAVERHEKTDEPGLIALDYLGTKTELIEFPAGEVLEELIIWFDRTWKTMI
jgi:hypothetical protein